MPEHPLGSNRVPFVRAWGRHALLKSKRHTGEAAAVPTACPSRSQSHTMAVRTATSLEWVPPSTPPPLRHPEPFHCPSTPSPHPAPFHCPRTPSTRPTPFHCPAPITASGRHRGFVSLSGLALLGRKAFCWRLSRAQPLRPFQSARPLTLRPGLAPLWRFPRSSRAPRPS